VIGCDVNSHLLSLSNLLPRQRMASGPMIVARSAKPSEAKTVPVTRTLFHTLWLPVRL
jgi:hypothetical protein